MVPRRATLRKQRDYALLCVVQHTERRLTCQKQRARAIGIHTVRISAGLNQELYDIVSASLSGHVESSHAILVSKVYVFSGGDAVQSIGEIHL